MHTINNFTGLVGNKLEHSLNRKKKNNKMFVLFVKNQKKKKKKTKTNALEQIYNVNEKPIENFVYAN